MNQSLYAIHRVMNNHRAYEVCDDCEDFAQRWYPDEAHKLWRRTKSRASAKHYQP